MSRGASQRAARRRGGPGDRLLTATVVVLALAVGAFLSSIVYRWTAPGPRSLAPPPAAAGTPPLARARIRVEVLNGTRVPGLADRLTDLLRARGFDVVNYGNADRPGVPATEILDRMGNPAFAREVALALPGTPIRRELAPDGFVDVTVVAGADWQRLFPAPGAGGGGARGVVERGARWLRERISGGRVTEPAPPVP